jgi:hypothetical protein
MPMTSAAESFGSFRPFPGNAGISARASEVRPRLPQSDPASAAFEGCDPAAIPETLTCGFVAELLGFLIATLASLLKVLEERGLVSTDAPSGLRHPGLAGLEKLARA